MNVRVLAWLPALVLVAAAMGCEDRRYVEPAPGGPVVPGQVTPPSKVDVNTPAGRVTVTEDAPLLVPRREVNVDVGNGGVQIDVDGKPLVERIRERREEQKDSLPPAP